MKRQREKTTPLQARLPESVYERAHKAARADHRSLTGLTVMLIEKHLDDAPQAVDDYELWLLRASRAVRKKDPEEWGAALRDLAGKWAAFGGKMEDDLYESLGGFSKKSQQQRADTEDRGVVRATRHRRT